MSAIRVRKTIAARRLTRAEVHEGLLLEAPIEARRPRTREECAEVERPCPFVSCKHHLYLDVSPETGSIKLNFPDIEPDAMVESCVWDVADRGGVTLEEVGTYLNITRERVRQIETRALLKLKMDGELDGERDFVRLDALKRKR